MASPRRSVLQLPEVRRGGVRPAIVGVVVVAWTGLWIAMGLMVAAEVRGLTKLSDTVVSVGRAADQTAQTLDALRGLPVVGDRLAEPARRLGEAGASAVASGRASRESARDLSVLLGLSIAVIPLTPLLVLLAFRLRALRQPTP